MVRHSVFLLTPLILLSLALAQPPAGNRPAQRAEFGRSVLPGGREITPQGQQFFTGPGPFGLALSASGQFVATADGGPNRYAITLLENNSVKHLRTTRKRSPGDGDDSLPDDDPDWHSVFMGLAFDGDRILYASEGESGCVRGIDVVTGKRTALINVNQNGYQDSYTGDLAIDRPRGLLFVVDQANFRLVEIDIRQQKVLQSVRAGRLPFAVGLSTDGRTAFVTDAGMFEYRALPGADPKRAKETGLPFPAFGFPSPEAVRGVSGHTESGAVAVPGLGAPNAPGSNGITIIDVANPQAPRMVAQVPTGLPFGGKVYGGSSPSGIAVTADRVFVSNANQDSISVFDAKTHRRSKDIALRIPGYESLRGVLPIGMAPTADSKFLLVAEAGINAIGVVDLAAGALIGHIPTGWFPTQVRVLGETVYVANAKGHGTGPNGDRAGAQARSYRGELRRGTISRFPFPRPADLADLTRQTVANNGFGAQPAPRALPPQIDHVVIIVKENRTYDEILGDLPPASNGPREGAAALARWGQRVTPNHHALAQRFSSSDNFYADSEVSVDGHHWIAGSYPNAWVTSSLMAAYGGQKTFRLPTTAPGRLLFAVSDSSVHPEDQLEAGALWHHLERNHISFRNFGEGFELAGVDEGDTLEPTGARFLTNVPMPEPLYRNTSRRYPGFNTNIPDQYRASQMIAELNELYGKGKPDLPRLIFIHLPNDHTAKARPRDGYPSAGSYVADNDLALGRMVEYFSHSEWWPKMAIFITEDDAQSGIDHVDSHRTLLLIASPYARPNYAAHANTSLPGLLRTAFELLRLPPLNLYDATAAGLSDCFTSQADLTPFVALPVDTALFDPAKVRMVRGAAPGPKMDDPKEIERQRREQRRNQNTP